MKRDVWILRPGNTMGSEQARERPCIEVGVFLGNHMRIVIPTSRSADPDAYDYHALVHIPRKRGQHEVATTALCEQIRAVAQGRLVGDPIGQVDADEFQDVLKALTNVLDLGSLGAPTAL